MNERYKRGLADIPPPTDYDTPRPIYVMVKDLNNDCKLVDERKLDYSKFEDRKYLGKLTFFAITNHYSIETMALADAEPPISEAK